MPCFQKEASSFLSIVLNIGLLIHLASFHFFSNIKKGKLLNMQYELHLNLRQRAALRTAVSFWERKEVKNKAAEFLESCDNFKINEVRKKWREFIKSVVDEWTKDRLPKKLEDELIHIVKMIGETILYWYLYIKHVYEGKKAINCINEIKWTPYGTVDVIEIFKSSWLENIDLDVTKVYKHACILVSEEHIDDLWQQIPKDIQENHYKDIYVLPDQHILAYWKCHRDNDISNLLEYIDASLGNLNPDSEEFDRLYALYNFCEHVYDLNRSVEENMLQLSVHQGSFFATKYFWNKLTKEGKNRNIIDCIRMAVRDSYHYENLEEPIEGCIREKYVEICIFLMNQMTEAHKKHFFNEVVEVYTGRASCWTVLDMKDEILRMLLSIWPWQEMFIPVLKDMLKYQDKNSRMTCMFLHEITSKMIEDHKLGYSLEASRYRSLLRESWLIIPSFIKCQMVYHRLTLRIVPNLISVSDLDSLKLIVNDPDIAVVRDEFIFFKLDVYERFIFNNQFEILNEFMKEIFRSDEDKGLFRTFVCKTLVLHERYDLLNKYVDWMSQTEEEKRKCEDHLKSDQFLILVVYKIWWWFKRNIDEAKYESCRFLTWALKSNEEITRFKREKLVNLEINQLNINKLVELNRDGNLDEFLSWCLLDDDGVRLIKQVVSERN